MVEDDYLMCIIGILVTVYAVSFFLYHFNVLLFLICIFFLYHFNVLLFLICIVYFRFVKLIKIWN